MSAEYGDDRLILAHAIRIANRLQKACWIDGFYQLKDRWILANQHELSEGHFVRQELSYCYNCNGKGQCRNRACVNCDGTGIHRTRYLYEHHFDIAGSRFVFHSYLKPQFVGESKLET